MRSTSYSGTRSPVDTLDSLILRWVRYLCLRKPRYFKGENERIISLKIEYNKEPTANTIWQAQEISGQVSIRFPRPVNLKEVGGTIYKRPNSDWVFPIQDVIKEIEAGRLAPEDELSDYRMQDQESVEQIIRRFFSFECNMAKNIDDFIAIIRNNRLERLCQFPQICHAIFNMVAEDTRELEVNSFWRLRENTLHNLMVHIINLYLRNHVSIAECIHPSEGLSCPDFFSNSETLEHCRYELAMLGHFAFQLLSQNKNAGQLQPSILFTVEKGDLDTLADAHVNPVTLLIAMGVLVSDDVANNTESYRFLDPEIQKIFAALYLAKCLNNLYPTRRLPENTIYKWDEQYGSITDYISRQWDDKLSVLSPIRDQLAQLVLTQHTCFRLEGSEALQCFRQLTHCVPLTEGSLGRFARGFARTFNHTWSCEFQLKHIPESLTITSVSKDDNHSDSLTNLAALLENFADENMDMQVKTEHSSSTSSQIVITSPYPAQLDQLVSCILDKDKKFNYSQNGRLTIFHQDQPVLSETNVTRCVFQ